GQPGLLRAGRRLRGAHRSPGRRVRTGRAAACRRRAAVLGRRPDRPPPAQRPRRPRRRHPAVAGRDPDPRPRPHRSDKGRVPAMTTSDDHTLRLPAAEVPPVPAPAPPVPATTTATRNRYSYQDPAGVGGRPARQYVYFG